MVLLQQEDEWRDRFRWIMDWDNLKYQEKSIQSLTCEYNRCAKYPAIWFGSGLPFVEYGPGWHCKRMTPTGLPVVLCM